MESKHSLCSQQMTGDTASHRVAPWLAGGVALAICCSSALGAEVPAAARFRKDVQPILREFCYDCHGDGAKKGEVAFDELKTDAALLNHELWLKVLKNTRAGLMPPEKKPQPSAAQKAKLESWIKHSAFGIAPKNPDPGRVTVRRLNRVEYRNTIHDLMGVDFNTEKEFPPDDTGHGFDNIADVLTLSPMLLEKYLDAAKAIVSEAVPTVPGVVAEKMITGRSFRRDEPGASGPSGPSGGKLQGTNSLTLSYYQPASVTNSVRIEQSGRYELVVDLTANERYVENRFDYNKCRLVFKADGQALLQQEFLREGSKPFAYKFDRDWKPGEHELVFDLEPVLPVTNQIRSLTLRINSVTVRGPFEAKFFVKPKNYERFFPKEIPKAEAAQRDYARELLGHFAAKAFRGPVDDATVDRLAVLAEQIYRQPPQTFEGGIAQTMVAVLASPRFLFREESVEPGSSGKSYPLIDEYGLASRLSYFLWSTMPDEELIRLARGKSLRKNLTAQVKRMLAHPRADALTENFSGQWLQARDIESVQIESRAVLARDEGNTGNQGGGRGFGNRGFGRQQRPQLDAELRQAMRRETEMYFGHIAREDRSVLELIESDYTFLNERLARHYGLTNLSVTGTEMRRVTLPRDSERGGVLTHGTVLAVTSNPNRTSPVKRGVFVLDNILGAPPAPPPPDIPPLEDAGKESTHRLTLRQTLALHREQPLCSSCHNRMDPLGLALENFNAMGMWRAQELRQPIDAGGKLITGESFINIQTLKHILATKHAREFYRTLTGKLLTYALGRGLDYYDVETVDQIVARLEKENGHFSALLLGVVESAPFQKTRNSTTPAGVDPVKPVEQRAEVKP